MSKKVNEKADSVAQKTYQYSDYFSNEQLDNGVATSHEQVSDTYMEGTIDRKIDSANTRDDISGSPDIPRKL